MKAPNRLIFVPMALALVVQAPTAWTQNRSQPSEQSSQRDRPRLPTPDFANVSYGPHERNVFDLWLAKSEKPTPLVIYYHGGGFRGGDKQSLNPTLHKRLLQRGISVAAANYRLSDSARYPAQMHDCARALQFIRNAAESYHIDPGRVGATGGSAGAGISMWLAFHDDLAKPNSDDPVARQSTRVASAVVYGAQSSYDPRFIMKLFDTDQIHEALFPFFGLNEVSDVNDPALHPLFEGASVINHVSSDDAPVMLYYPQANEPLPKNSTGRQHIHHPKFGFVLKEKMASASVECVLLLREDHPDGPPFDRYAQFFARTLRAN